MTATLDRPAAAEPDTPSWRDRLQPLVTGSGGWPVTLAVTVLAGLLRFLRVDQPATTLTDKGVAVGPGQMFDELYYACDAQSLVRYGVEHASTTTDGHFCQLQSGAPAFVVHPSLGKWLIGLGEQLFGFNSFGWRFAAALFGTLTVLLVIRIGRRMTGSTLLGGLAGLFLALDGLHFVQSRIATLDVFLCFFVTAAFGALVIDRDQIRARLAEATDEQLARGGPLGFRRWRFVAGLMLGLALSTKWSALWPMVVLLVPSLFWEAGARRAAGIRAPWRTTLRLTTAPFVGVFLVLPVAVYVGSWTGWFVNKGGWDRNWAAEHPHTSFPMFPSALRSLWHYHAEILRFHDTLSAKHPYQSHPLSWPFLQRPVSYYYPPGIKVGVYGCQTSTGCSREVLAIGTPALWWAMLPLAIALIYRWAAKRDWAAASLLLLMAVSILAWIPSDQKDRTMFLFYALPSVPFLCLGLALIAGWLMGPPGSTRRLWGTGAVGVYTSLVVLNFSWLYPVLAAVTIPYHDWHQRMWFSSWI
ncbi:MAG: dolichyl-phosphate-mannose--protein mannosyltransferase [Mycobacteriales bacterium]